jgi:hypothetical protein
MPDRCANLSGDRLREGTGAEILRSPEGQRTRHPRPAHRFPSHWWTSHGTSRSRGGRFPARSRSAWDCPLRSGEDNGSAERQGVSGGWRRGEDGVRRRHRDTRQGGRSSGRKVSLAVGTQVLAVGGEKYWCCRVCKRVMHGTSPFVRRRRQAFGPVPSRPMQGRPDPVGQHWCSAVDEHQPPA